MDSINLQHSEDQSLLKMKSEEEIKFDPKDRLPPELQIPGSGTHLYQIGLSLFPVNGVKRSKTRRPLLIFLLEVYYVIRSVVVLLLPEQSLYFYRLLGDFGFVFGTRAHFALTVIFSILLAINSHLLNYFNYIMGVKPTDFQLFDMMSGKASPKSIGLSNKHIISELLRRARILFFIGDYIPLSLGSTIVFINLFSFYSNSSIIEIVLYVIPNSFGWFVIVNIVYSIILWQLIYFYLITFYLKYKLKEINQRLNRLRRGDDQNPFSFRKLTENLVSIYTEIAEYDDNYWSKFLAFVWMSCGTILSTLSFFIIFGQMIFIIRIFCLYFDLFFISMLLWVVHICATVYLEVNKSYKLLNSLMTKWNRKEALKGLKVCPNSWFCR